MQTLSPSPRFLVRFHQNLQLDRRKPTLLKMDAFTPMHLSLTYDYLSIPQDSLPGEQLNARYLDVEALERVDFLPSLSDLGSFENLPTELLLDILDLLPLHRLMDFRRLNRRAMNTVDSALTLQAILLHAPHAFRGILAIQTTAPITLPYLYKKLREQHCDSCGKLAQHLWLPTCLRFCFTCAHRVPTPLNKEGLLRHQGLDPNDISLILRFRFFSATFANDLNIVRMQGQHILYDSNTAAQIISERTGKRAKQPTWGDSSLKGAPLWHNRSRVRNLFILHKGEPPLRVAMATVIAPWICSGGAETGFFCATSLYTKDQDQIYTRAT